MYKFYGCQLLSLESKQLTRLNTAWRVSSRRILKLDRCTRSAILPGLMSTGNPSLMIKKRIFKFFFNGVRHKSENLKFYLLNCIQSGDSIMFRNITSIMRDLEISPNSILYCHKSVISNLKYYQDWRVDMIRKITKWRDNDILIELN